LTSSSEESVAIISAELIGARKPAASTTSVLAALRPPAQVRVLLSKSSLYDVFSMWYEHRFTTDNHPQLWKAVSYQDCSRIKAVIKYTEEVMPPDIREALHRVVPNLTEAEHAQWRTQFSTACANMAKHLEVLLHKADKKKTYGSATINSVYNRLLDQNIISKSK
jgi:hypothetical protein